MNHSSSVDATASSDNSCKMLQSLVEEIFSQCKSTTTSLLPRYQRATIQGLPLEVCVGAATLRNHRRRHPLGVLKKVNFHLLNPLLLSALPSEFSHRLKLIFDLVCSRKDGGRYPHSENIAGLWLPSSLMSYEQLVCYVRIIFPSSFFVPSSLLPNSRYHDRISSWTLFFPGSFL